MANPDATAMPTSEMNPFLFAGIGTQTNGVELTVLSLLARQGSDPWIEAGRLAGLPRGAAADWLAERIATMPLSASAIGAARDTASRLLLLLPARTAIERAVAVAKVDGVRIPIWAIVAVIVLALGLAVAMTQGSWPRDPEHPGTSGGLPLPPDGSN